MSIEAGAYSFLTNTLTIAGPNGSFTMGGPDTASGEGGFTWTFSEDTNQQTGSADGSTMNSFIASLRGKCTVRLQKTSPINALLNQLWQQDRANGGITWGQNVLTHRDVNRGDLVIGHQAAFTKHPNITAAKVGGEMEWEFDCGKILPSLGPGNSTVIGQ
jgi:hypothetical protein